MTSPSPTPDPAQSRPRSRYGSQAEAPSAVAEPKPSVVSKALAVFIAAMLALMVFLVGRSVLQQQARPVTAEFITQERLDDETARLWIEVDRKDTDQDAYCIVFAVDYDHSEIGRREVVIPAGGEKLQRLAVDMPTREPVASGRIYGCSQQLPPYMTTSTTFFGARP